MRSHAGVCALRVRSVRTGAANSCLFFGSKFCVDASYEFGRQYDDTPPAREAAAAHHRVYNEFGELPQWSFTPACVPCFLRCAG